MRKKACVVLAIIGLLISTSACTWSHQHPKATVAIIVGAGVGFGVLAGIETRGTFCPTTINGYKYMGTAPCPGPNYDPNPKGKHK